MKQNKSLERIAFLAKKFNIFTEEDFTLMTSGAMNNKYIAISTPSANGLPEKTHENVIALYTVQIDEKGLPVYRGNRCVINRIGVSEKVFIEMVEADPTHNKIHVQWMLNVFNRYVRDGDVPHAIRFATEDLGQANQYLTLFEENKYKKVFKKLCKSNFAVNRIQDPSDINQYKNLSQLFDAVDPYIEKDMSTLELEMKRFVSIGEAAIPFHDRHFTVFTPKSLDSSKIFNAFASWRTTSSGSYFESYRKQETPFGGGSELYIIVNNNFFHGEGHPEYEDGLWQFHFESNQTMHKGNGTEQDITGRILDKSEGIKEYFYDLLIKFARASKNVSTDNKYVKHLINFGFGDILFEVIDPEVSTINLSNEKIAKLPDISNFKNLTSLYLKDVGLTEWHESIGDLKELCLLAVPHNKLKEIPRSICFSKKLIMLNLVGNAIESVPDEISNLDISNGGSLSRLSVSKGLVSEGTIKKIKKLLPRVDVVEYTAE